MKLFECHYSAMQALAFTLTKNLHDAEDLVQDIVEKILHKKEFFETRPIEEQKKLATTYMKHYFIDICRKKAVRVNRKKADNIKPVLSVAPDVESIMESKYLTGVIKSINPKHSVMLLAFANGHTCSELAKEADCSVNAVLSRVRYGRKAVVKQLTINAAA